MCCNKVHHLAILCKTFFLIYLYILMCVCINIYVHNTALLRCATICKYRAITSGGSGQMIQLPFLLFFFLPLSVVITVYFGG